MRLNSPKFRHQLLLFLLFYTVMQLGYSTSWYAGQQSTIERATLKLQERLALDLPQLRLADPRLNTAIDESLVQRYIHQLNQQLQNQQWPLRVLSIQGAEVAISGPTHQRITRQLSLSQGPIPVIIEQNNKPLWQSFSFLALLLSIFLAWALKPSSNEKHHASHDPDTAVAEEQVYLTVDLNQRCLTNRINGNTIQLPNKPYCFYLALLEFCHDNPDQSLHHHKPVPDELSQLANKYFHRLIELGHTIRKRPDFNTNLDKMLSEIRAALDDIFDTTPELKPYFYPPKARGEGSRSRLHSYALGNLDKRHYEVIGK